MSLKHAAPHTILTVSLLVAGIYGVPVEAQSRVDTTFAVRSGALVDLTVRNGSVSVRGTDRSDGLLRTGNRTVTLNVSGVRVSTRRSTVSSNRQDNDEHVELLLPRGVRLIISAGAADVDVRDVDGDVEVHSSGGDILMSRLGARAILETLSGDIDIDGGVDDLRATTASGDINAREISGETVVRTTSGDIHLTGSPARLNVETISGDISFMGSLASNANVQLTTHSGDVTLQLPENTRGQLEFATHNGSINTALPLTMLSGRNGLTNQQPRMKQRFTFGSRSDNRDRDSSGIGNTNNGQDNGSGAFISITTFNGDFRLVRSSRR